MDDVELLATDVEDRGDVLVHEGLRQFDLHALDPQQPVGADEPDELDRSFPRQLFRDREVLRRSPRRIARRAMTSSGVAPLSAA
jgi:hypothetical protein